MVFISVYSVHGDVLLNDPVHNHANQLLTRTSREAEKNAIKLSMKNPTVVPRRVLGDLSNTILASPSPDAIYTMRSKDAFAQVFQFLYNS